MIDILDGRMLSLIGILQLLAVEQVNEKILYKNQSTERLLVFPIQ